MAMIQVQHLTFSYPSNFDTIFEDLNLQIDTDWKLGFIGRNGRGKTTFLNLLMGRYEYSGKILSPVSFEYFPYPVLDKSCATETVLAGICPNAEKWELEREAFCLGLEEETLSRSFACLSNGEQTKALLAALFLKEGRFLLIDEPTNHLDTKARESVAAYLKKKKGFILVSHDRRFLDGCVDHILSLNRSGIELQSGNFSSWFTNFERRQEFQLAQNEKLKKQIDALQKSAQRTALWSGRIEASKYGNGPVDRGYIGHKSAKMMKRAKAIEARRQRAAEERSGLLKDLETAEKLRLAPLKDRTGVLVSLQKAAPVYEQGPVCRPVSFTLEQGERVALEGGNGSGKSSLLKLLLGAPIEHTGMVETGAGVRISYVPQDASHLRGSFSEFVRENRLEESLFKAILRRMDFERVQFEKQLEELSAGQKKKVLLARSLCEQAHIYIWDEPLNYIDLYSRIQLENLIQEYQPTMLFAEHDAAFKAAVATRTIPLQK